MEPVTWGTRPGRVNANVDALSKAPVDNKLVNYEESCELQVAHISCDELRFLLCRKTQK